MHEAPALPSPEAWIEASRRWTTLAEIGGFERVPLDHDYIQRPLIQSLAQAVRRWPANIAVATGGRTLTYRQFWNLVALYGSIVAETGAPNGPIALLLRAYATAAAALFAGVISGRACLTLDCSHPVERNAAAIRLADAALVVIQQGDQEARAAAGGRRVLPLDPGAPSAVAPDTLPSRLGQDEPAFILPTSGSTGEPKLVVHSQRTEAYRASQRGDAAGMREADRVMVCSGPPTSYSGIGFLLAPLRIGAAARLINMRQEGMRGLLRRLAEERISVLLAGSSLLRTMFDLAEARHATSHLRLVRIGGEATTHADVALFRSMLPEGCALETGYGATEATNLRWPIPPLDTRDPIRVPAGYPELGGDFVLLADDGGVCPPGMAGELVVRSRYNALGEWMNGRCVPGRLIPDPADPGQRVYFTRDISRQTEDGGFIMLRRKDRQVQINGQRVEPTEIEAVLRQAPGVVDAIVLPRTDVQVTVLLAFVAAGEDADPSLAATLRQLARAKLPGHMVPAHIEVMAELPRLPGGKPDAMRLLAKN